MATAFKKTSIQPVKSIREKITPDTLYWKNLQSPVIIKEYGAVTHIDFCPKSPYNFAVTNSMRVQLYSCSDHTPLGTVSRFKDTAYCGSYRRDGGLLVAGTEDSLIKLFNPGSRSLLRTFKGHTGAVHVTRFLEDQFRVVSGADDNTVRVWDIPTEQSVHVYRQHEDYVRCGVASMSSQDIFITGAYDHTVRLWDARVPDGVMCVTHGAPVESVLMFPNGGIFLSAGGNTVKVWDALAGGKLLATLSHHHKTVTSLCFCSDYQRFMTASLDKHVKVVDVASYQVVHTLSYSGPILSHAVSPDDQTLVVGMADKMLSVQHRKPPEDGEKVERKSKRAGRMRGGPGGAMRTFTPSKSDSVVTLKKREVLAPYDRQLKSFNHSKALDAALELRLRRTAPEVSVSVLGELMHRGAVRRALAGRDDRRLGVLLAFIHKNLSNPQYMGTLLDVLTLILDMYGMCELMTSGPTQALLLKLQKLAGTEVKLMGLLTEVMGGLDMLRAAAENSLSNAEASHNSSAKPNGSVAMETDEHNKDVTQSAHMSVLKSIGSLAVTDGVV